MNGSRIKVGIFGDLQPGLNSKIFKVEISTGKLVASQQEVIPTKIFLFVQVVVFRLPASFSSQAIDVRCEQNTFTRCMHRHEHFVSTSHMMLHAHAWLKLCLKYFPHLVICRAPCRLTRTARLPCCSPLYLHLPHLLFLAHAQRRFNREPAPIDTAFEVTVLRNPNLALM